MAAAIPLWPLSPGARRLHTFYTAHGDVFGWVCVGWMVVMTGRKLAARWRGRKIDKVNDKVESKV